MHTCFSQKCSARRQHAPRRDSPGARAARNADHWTPGPLCGGLRFAGPERPQTKSLLTWYVQNGGIETEWPLTTPESVNTYPSGSKALLLNLAALVVPRVTVHPKTSDPSLQNSDRSPPQKVTVHYKRVTLHLLVSNQTVTVHSISAMAICICIGIYEENAKSDSDLSPLCLNKKSSRNWL